MPLRHQIARIIGKTSHWFLTHFTKGGSALPGKLALSIDPTILTHLRKNYQIIIVTGTNGKTLTTALIVEALKSKYPHLVTNPSGSNMEQGIISTFLQAPLLKDEEQGIAILEVDEGSLAKVVDALQPQYFVFTNVFRDQLDRYGELHTIYQFLFDAARKVPHATIIANGDLPMFNQVSLKNPKIFFGFDHEADHEVTPHYNTDGILCPQCDHVLHYQMISYANLGKYYCPHCGFHRPELTYKLTAINELNLRNSRFEIDGHTFRLPIAGKYNLYNALAAYALARELGIETSVIRDRFEHAQSVFGRQETFQIGDKKVLLNLVKNPVGLDQVIDLLAQDQEAFSLVAILNNQAADGTDVSWIWDGNFELLAQLPLQSALAAGNKVEDMAQRLVIAGVNPNKLDQTNQLEDIIPWIQASKSQNIHILATYTAMLTLRDQLIKQGYLK